MIVKYFELHKLDINNKKFILLHGKNDGLKYEEILRLQKNNMVNKVGFKDLGAGGVACASIELADAAGMGAEVWADKIHTSMDNLQSHVILCSESQERFM